jgi:hypothetical protein
VYAADRLTASKRTIKARDTYINRLEFQLVQAHHANAAAAGGGSASSGAPALQRRESADAGVQCQMASGGGVGASAASSMQRDDLRRIAARLGMPDALDSSVCASAQLRRPHGVALGQRKAAVRNYSGSAPSRQEQPGAASARPSQVAAGAGIAPQRCASPTQQAHASRRGASTGARRRSASAARSGLSSWRGSGASRRAGQLGSRTAAHVARAPRDVYAYPEAVAEAGHWDWGEAGASLADLPGVEGSGFSSQLYGTARPEGAALAEAAIDVTQAAGDTGLLLQRCHPAVCMCNSSRIMPAPEATLQG